MPLHRNSVIGEALGAHHHNVTIFSPYFVKTPPKGVTYILINSKTNAIENYTKNKLTRNRKQCELLDFLTLAWLTSQMCHGVSSQNCDKVR